MSPDRGTGTEGPFPSTEGLDSLSCTQEPQTASAPALPNLVPQNAAPPHLSHDPKTNAKRTDPFQFGQRYLDDKHDVFEFNAWDHVAPDDEHLAYSETQYAAQRASPVSDFDRERFNKQPEKWWDLFYKQKTSTFFKDRKWLLQEFPTLRNLMQSEAGPKVLLEVGAGAGNTAFPILRMNENPELKIIAADFSKKAVETIRESEDYRINNNCMQAEVWDAAGDTLPESVQENTVDVVIMIFIFSALNPRQWAQAVKNVWRVLKPGGEILFRDYGRGDLAQVRFKAGRWMEENFYVRGDGTRVYFFDKDELEQIWTGSYFDNGKSNDVAHFNILNLDVDRRLIVNRQRRVKMYRCWLQGRFRKPGGW